MAGGYLIGSPLATTVLLASSFVGRAVAHDHHEGVSHIAEGETISVDPIDKTLWIHIVIQMFAYGVVFPIGMVLGISKSRWHVPTQIFGTGLAVLGFFLGHAHGGREFVGNNVHAMFAHILQITLAAQVVLGLYLKLHWEKGILGKVRKLVRPLHSIIGKAMPVLSWAQLLFGGITALGFCQGDHLGQCAAHFIMGSAFIAYGIILAIILNVGQLWIRRSGRSQEFFDSAVIAAWGCVNTFTEHHWGTAWVRNDWQHTTMGIIWWAAGLAGMWLSRDRDGNPKRNFVPSFVIFMTGWAFGAHPQTLMVSAATHSMFGYTLMAVGVTRAIEISFVLKDEHSLTEDGRTHNSFQYVPIFLLYAAGFLFMGAQEEQMLLVDQSSMDHVAYLLILFSLAFLTFLFSNMLIGLYDRLANPPLNIKKFGTANGHLSEEGQVRRAEEFELEGLMSDDENDESRGMLRRSGSIEGSSSDSPSTIGKNNVSSV